MMTGPAPGEVANRLNELLATRGQPVLDPELALRFASYADLLLRWNSKMNLSAIRDLGGILESHFVESIVAARLLPRGIKSLLDFGSGAGFPGIPIALCHPDLRVTLAESQGKKAGFLREAVRVTAVSAVVHAGRAETLAQKFDCVTLRAVDQMKEAIAKAIPLIDTTGWLVILTTVSDVSRWAEVAGSQLLFRPPQVLPGQQRVLISGRKAAR